MESETMSGEDAPLATHAAVCGLFCRACSLYIATQEDPALLKTIAQGFGWTEEEARCDGCRAERQSKYCQTCSLSDCASSRGIRFCVECSDYPCGDLKTFQSERPHRADLFSDLARIKEIGPSRWSEEALERYACPVCGIVNSAYHLQCRSCGHSPSNSFVADHESKITQALQDRLKK